MMVQMKKWQQVFQVILFKLNQKNTTQQTEVSVVY